MRATVPPHEYFVCCNDTNRISMVMDISLGGLKIECFPSAESKPQATMIDIYSLPQERLYLAGVPCRIVYDVADLEQNDTFSGSNKRIAGMQYQKLTDAQKDKLEHFLNFMAPDFSG